MKISELAFPEVQRIIERGAVALWPTGSTEAHGPHLPLDTDVLISEETCLRAVPRVREAHGLEALVLPPLAYTITNFAAPFSGTINVPRESVVPYVRDVAVGIAQQGFRAVILVNAHLEPAHRFALRDAVELARGSACPIALADPADRRFASTLTEEFASGSCHAGQYETSLVLAARPEGVREAERGQLTEQQIDLVKEIKGGAKDFKEAGAPNAYTGDPVAATTEEGERSYARLVEIVVEVLTEALEGPR